MHSIVEPPGIFQGYNFFHLIGLYRNKRDQFLGRLHFAATADFIAKHDSPAFARPYDTAPLNFFEPMVMRLFERPLNGIDKAAID